MSEFVTIDIAKKLNEKGFDWKSLYVYNKEQIINPKVIEEYGELSDDGYYELTKEGGGKLDWSFVYINEYQLCQYRDVVFINDILRAPTISQVLKWLRDEKKLYITPSDILIEDNMKWDVQIDDLNTSDIIYESRLIYSSYEEAVIAGIEYVLNNLI